MSTDKSRQEAQPAFVLHSYPYRETSLVVEIFSRHFGRVALVARGAKRPKSAVRAVLMAFQPLLLSWFGKAELRTLHAAEWQGGQPQLQGTALLCGFYLNELLVKLLPRDDPHENLFDYYLATLQQLASSKDHSAILRRFEIKLLQELGYAMLLDHDVRSSLPVIEDKSYHYIVEQGPVLASAKSTDGVTVDGKTLLNMAADNYADPVTVHQSKLLMRLLLNHYLGNQVLHTRQILKDLQQL